ncbi:MAG: amidohydrolase family protein [Syntrophales bacterium]
MTISMKIIDSHMHCGVQNSNLPLETLRRYLEEGGIQGACLFAPVEDIYDRYDYGFIDNAAWINCRRLANEYLLDIQKTNPDFHAYYFVWNDFRKEELVKGYRAVKWHRHEYEPVYHYDDPRCEEFLQEVYRLRLPVVLEESFGNTRCFIRRVDGRTSVIIPHLGGLNGGFAAIRNEGIWKEENIYADTALASGSEIAAYLDRYGSGRLLFGSDFPFGIPGHELQKIVNLGVSKEEFNDITGGNILRLLNVG